MSVFHIVLIFNEYYIQIVAVLTKQMQNRNRQFPNTRNEKSLEQSLFKSDRTEKGVSYTEGSPYGTGLMNINEIAVTLV